MVALTTMMGGCKMYKEYTTPTDVPIIDERVGRIFRNGKIV